MSDETLTEADRELVENLSIFGASPERCVEEVMAIVAAARADARREALAPVLALADDLCDLLRHPAQVLADRAEGLTTTQEDEYRDLRAAYDRDVWAGEWNSLPTAIDRVVAAARADARREALAPVLALADEWSGATCITDGAPCSWHRVAVDCATELRAVASDPDTTRHDGQEIE